MLSFDDEMAAVDPDRNGILGTLLALLVIINVLALLAVYLPNFLQQNAGFGPDWDCTPQAKGGPGCIKKPGPLRDGSHIRQTGQPVRQLDWNIGSRNTGSPAFAADDIRRGWRRQIGGLKIEPVPQILA